MLSKMLFVFLILSVILLIFTSAITVTPGRYIKPMMDSTYFVEFQKNIIPKYGTFRECILGKTIDTTISISRTDKDQAIRISEYITNEYKQLGDEALVNHSYGDPINLIGFSFNVHYLFYKSTLFEVHLKCDGFLKSSELGTEAQYGNKIISIFLLKYGDPTEHIDYNDGFNKYIWENNTNFMSLQIIFDDNKKVSSMEIVYRSKFLMKYIYDDFIERVAKEIINETSKF